jgi:hypothetical protein
MRTKRPSKSLACSKFAATTRPDDFALPELPRSRKGDDIVTVPDDGKRNLLHQRTEAHRARRRKPHDRAL